MRPETQETPPPPYLHTGSGKIRSWLDSAPDTESGTSLTLYCAMAFQRRGRGIVTRADGQRLRRIRGARDTHMVIRASGRVRGEEARAARSEYARQRRLARVLSAATSWKTKALLRSVAHQSAAADDE